MNKALIEQLMTKASEIRVSGFGDTEILDPYKFAELIVKECVKLLDERDPDFNAYSKRVVKQHFGVNV
jgi:hypothetical protein